MERRARERFEKEQAEYEEKVKRRQKQEEETGKKARGRTPRPPQEGPQEKDQVNFTDEESRIMPSSAGFVQAYNAQATVDTATHLIVREPPYPATQRQTGSGTYSCGAQSHGGAG